MTRSKDVRYERFDDLIERHGKLVRRLCWRHSSGSESVCEELVQDCYISIFLHITSLRSGANVLQEATWVVWQCWSVFSRWKRRRKRDYIPLDELMSDTCPDATDNELLEQIKELSVNLTPKESETLEMILKGYTVKEIAERANLQPDSIKKQRQRIIQKMKQAYEDIQASNNS